MDIFVQLIIMVASIFTGLFALIKYFLKHLEKKDARMERIEERFNTTVTNHLRHSQISQDKLTASNDRLESVMERMIQKM